MTEEEIREKLGLKSAEEAEYDGRMRWHIHAQSRPVRDALRAKDRQTGRTTNMIVKLLARLSEGAPCGRSCCPSEAVVVVHSYDMGRFIRQTVEEYGKRLGINTSGVTYELAHDETSRRHTKPTFFDHVAVGWL